MRLQLWVCGLSSLLQALKEKVAATRNKRKAGSALSVCLYVLVFMYRQLLLFVLNSSFVHSVSRTQFRLSVLCIPLLIICSNSLVYSVLTISLDTQF